MTTQTETNVKYDRMFETFTSAKYDEVLRLVALQNSRRDAQAHQDVGEVFVGFKRFTYQTKEGIATIRVNPIRKTIELSTLVDQDLSDRIKKVLEIK